MALSVNLNGRCFCVITGASQGIGRSIAIECAHKMGPASLMVLIARNKDGLQMTKSLINSPSVKVVTKSINLSTATVNDLESALIESLSNTDIKYFDTNIIIHNAGSIGDVTVPADQLNDLKMWQEYYNLNVFNIASLNCTFLKICSDYEDRTLVVNITSLCCMKPFAGLALYCSGKAAREMYFKVLAEEHPKLKVLNYSPGPVQTDMVQHIIDNATNDSLKDSFVSMQNEKQLLQPGQTAKKCVDVICAGNYKSGDHIDYFD
ncbi:sepiapterin reductase-like [Arctopsyche grandis]|uniref:sepiapterin reductase-like n=1 Tax=Arctopsyche grandis TaxID=121162 RepID=UPI00406D7375